jgi:AAA domain
VAKAVKLIKDDGLRVDRETVMVVDEASMVGTPELNKQLSCAVVGRAKIVLVGDCTVTSRNTATRIHRT